MRFAKFDILCMPDLVHTLSRFRQSIRRVFFMSLFKAAKTLEECLLGGEKLLDVFEETS